MSALRDQINSLVIIQQATMLRSVTTGWTDTMISDYTQKAQAILDIADNFTLVGSGDPNTAGVKANASLMYIDTGATELWINPTFGATSGWVNKG